MAKNMAKVEDGVVTNILWCSDGEKETDTLRNPADRPVGIGDLFKNSKWYRGSKEILTPLEDANNTIADLWKQLLNAQKASETSDS